MMLLTDAAALLTVLCGLLALCGLIVVAAGVFAVSRFTRQAIAAPHSRPPVTVLKPLCGDEPRLLEALSSICDQAYPLFQIVFGVQDAHDPALAIIGQIRARFPACDIAVVVDPLFHGPNRKISNLINMLAAARHEILLFSDSDLHVAPDYLDRIVAALEAPSVGLVTTLCGGLPTAGGPVARLGASAISHSFLPGALLSRLLGREDCLGITMALRRQTLRDIGGLESLVGHLADDNILGQRVQELGLTIGLADTVPVTGVPERSLRALWQHELRWARTIRSLQPVLFAASTIQFPLFWSLLALGFSGGSVWLCGLFALGWGTRAAAARYVSGVLLWRYSAARVAPVWWLPLRDVLSVAQVAASYLGGRVVWRGQVLQAGNHAGRYAGRRITGPAPCEAPAAPGLSRSHPRPR